MQNSDSPALVQRVTKLAEFVVSNSKFEAFIQGKETRKTEYSFLFGGYGWSYYRWILRYGMIVQKWNQATLQSHDMVMQFLEEIQEMGVTRDLNKLFLPKIYPNKLRINFQKVLESLDGQHKQIQAGREWFMKFKGFAYVMIYQMADYLVSQLQENKRKLNIIYLLNEILLKIATKAPQNAKPEKNTLRVVINTHFGLMLKILHLSATESIWQEFCEIVKFWGIKTILSSKNLTNSESVTNIGVHTLSPKLHENFDLIRRLIETRARKSNFGSAARPRTAASISLDAFTPAETQIRTVFTTVPYHQEPAINALPLPNGQGCSQSDAPNTIDLFSLPTGLIPKIVKLKKRVDTPYSPLSKDDIKDVKMPEKQSKTDDYFRSRIIRFYAETSAFKPGRARD